MSKYSVRLKDQVIDLVFREYKGMHVPEKHHVYRVYFGTCRGLVSKDHERDR